VTDGEIGVPVLANDTVTVVAARSGGGHGFSSFSHGVVRAVPGQAVDLWCPL